MAITIEQSPYTFLNLSGNPIMWVFSSTNTGQTNFEYYVELYINGVLDSTHTVYMEDGTKGKFDASLYAENNTTVSTLPSDITGGDAGNDCSVYLKVYERYGDPATTQAGSVQTTTTVYAVKAKKDMDDWNAFLSIDDDYTRPTGIPLAFDWLTEDVQMTIRDGETKYLTAVNRTTGTALNLSVYYYSDAGALLDTWVNAVTLNRVGIFAVVYSDIETAYAGAGTFADVKYIRVGLAGQSTDNWATYTIDRSCRLQTHAVHFLSQIGGVDSFTFDRLGVNNITVETKSFQTNRGGFDGSSYVWNGVNTSKGNYSTKTKKTMKLTSEWISEAKLAFLLDNLVRSPYILLETDAGLRRIANTGSSFKYKQKPFDALFNLEMTIDMGSHTSMVV